MTEESLSSRNPRDQHSQPRSVRIPGFDADTDVGLGDVIKRATGLVGIRPCGPCNERANRLNARFRLTGR